MEYAFNIVIEECEEGGYYAECPAFQGCHVEDESYEETINEMKQALTGFIEEYRKSGEEIPLDTYSIATVRVPV